MATAKKLPSGSWRVRVYSYTDSNGKKHYESFTASTKQQAEQMANKFSRSQTRADDVTVEQCVASYISANAGILSPSTIYGYQKDSKRFEPINHLKIRKLTSEDIQKFISGLSERGLSAKTIRNTYGLLSASLSFRGVDEHFKIHLPSVPKKRQYAPSEAQIRELYQRANPNIRKAIMLGCHSLRRGEICGLKYKDLSGNVLYVHSDVVTNGKKWIHKETPKTGSSNRYIYLSDDNLELLGSGKPDDYIVPIKPSTIGSGLYKLCKAIGIKMRFHDTRVYFSSIAANMGISDIYVSHLGGWSENSAVLKEHYQKPFETANEEYAHKLNEHLDDVFKKYDTKYDTDI